MFYDEAIALFIRRRGVGTRDSDASAYPRVAIIDARHAQGKLPNPHDCDSQSKGQYWRRSMSTIARSVRRSHGHLFRNGPYIVKGREDRRRQILLCR